MSICVYLCVCVCIYIYIYIYIQLFFFSTPGITLNQHLVAWIARQNLCQMTCTPLEVRQVWKWQNFHVGSTSHRIIANEPHGEMTWASLYQQSCFNGYYVHVRHKELWNRKLCCEGEKEQKGDLKGLRLIYLVHRKFPPSKPKSVKLKKVCCSVRPHVL